MSRLPKLEPPTSLSAKKRLGSQVELHLVFKIYELTVDSLGTFEG